MHDFDTPDQVAADRARDEAKFSCTVFSTAGPPKSSDLWDRMIGDRMLALRAEIATNRFDR